MRLNLLIFGITATMSLNISFGQCFLNTISNGTIIENSTGNVELDNLLLVQKNDLESFFGVNINLFYGTELAQSGNAFFSPSCSSINCNGQIVLGKYLMGELSNKSDSYTRLVSVFAHEFAHAVQHKFGWSGKSKWRELHADYLAGYYIGMTKTVNESEVISTFNEFSSQGDFDFNNPDFHGTPEERGCAFLEGFKYAYTGNTNVYAAYNTGKNYVIANNPCYKNKQTNTRPGYYFPTVTGSQYDGAVIIVAVVAATVLLSNDIYYRRVYSFRNPNPDDTLDFRNGNGWHFGFRRQFNRSALEYGVSSIGFKSKDALYPSIERNTFFNVNYVHDLNFARIPKRIVPYIGAGINLGNGAGLCGIAGFYIPVFDRFKFDFRYELGNKVNQLQFGLIFKYQKEYLWNKNK